jgi:hypothetical protein
VWGCPTEAILFNPSIGKLDPKTLSCHFIGYPDKSKGFCFYYPDRYTKIIETGHVDFLEDEMIRWSTVPREIRLDEKRVYVPTSMVRESFFSVPAAVTPIVQGNMIVEPVVNSPVPVAVIPIVSSPMTETNEEEESVFQEPIVNHEDVPRNEHPRRSQRARRSAISEDYEVMLAKKFKWRVIPPLLKKS